jgi:DNA end-binding protein Ku
MPRSIWNGTIAFGAVAVPIKLYSAVEAKTVHFHEVHLKDGARIEHRTFCTKEDKEVPRDEVVRGFEVRSGKYVVVDKEDVDAAGGTRARIIDVDVFVPLGDLDPVVFDKAYFVGPQDDGVDAYKLLQAALEKTERAAIGRFTFHNREYLIALRAYDDIMALHTMRFADELVGRSDLDVPRAAKKPDKREIDMAQKLIASMQEEFKPGRLKDDYREAILKAIKKKARSGKAIEAPEDDRDEAPSDDLAAALEASLA